MKRLSFLSLVLAILISMACAGTSSPTVAPVPREPFATPEPPATTLPITPTSVRTNQRDVTYCTTDGVELKMDVYYPANATRTTPLVVFIHGGGWSQGDKAETQGRLVPSLLDAGFTVASLNYRLAPEYPFPAQLEDVKCAIRSFRANADQYGIDPNHIGMWGPSAGGHLVSMLGVTDPAAGFERGEYLDRSSRVQAVVDMYGPADLMVDFSQTYVDLKDMVFGDFDLAKASPVTYISADDPPFLILQGDQDPVVPLSQSQSFYDAMIASGMQAELVVVQGGDHGFNNPSTTPNRDEIIAKVVQFFEEHLK
ncbi:MAG: alpha/beta hydrolase [Chloroflexi bacterium]|nr:alpha/beta hydrolase [Chloroflexota bacterium]